MRGKKDDVLLLYLVFFAITWRDSFVRDFCKYVKGCTGTTSTGRGIGEVECHLLGFRCCSETLLHRFWSAILLAFVPIILFSSSKIIARCLYSLKV